MKLETRLTRLLGKEKVFTSLPMREMYAYDSSPFISKPDMVVFVSCTDDVSRVMGLAYEYGVPVLARGAGTCLSGGAVPVKAGISLVMTRMNAILSIDPVSRTALVEPGVVNLTLQKALAPHNLIFPPDPASQKVATIGGNVAECAGGIQGAKYGVTKNYVLGLELVLSDGSVTTTGLLSEKETLGPDMTGIFNGSEGSLAVITKILVSCLPKAQSMRTALASFASLIDAARAVSAIIKKGIIPTALELMDQIMLRAVDDFMKIGFPKDAEAVLLMEVDGYEIDLDHQLALMKEICLIHHASDVKLAVNSAERENLWKARRAGNGALGRIRPAYMVHDVTVPRHQVATLLTRIQDIGKTQGIIIAQMAHAGDGNAHPHLLYYPDEENIQQRLHDATKQMFKVALELGGTISGEHGIGLEKKAFMGMQFSRTDLAFMEKIQRAMDPSGILNPGKIFPTKPEAEASEPIQGPGGTTGVENKSGKSKGGSNQILEFIPDNLTLKVHGDTPLWKVQETAATINAFLPLCTHTQGDHSMRSLVETGACGHEAFALGSLKEYIYGLEFTTWAGEWISTGGHTVKNVAGYDFTRLLWKSMGNLGILQTLTLKLLPCPESRRLIVETFSSLGACIAYAKALLKADICLCTLKANGQFHGGRYGWQMITGLAGSAALVELHTALVCAINPSDRSSREIFDMEDQKSFWRNQAEETSSYPFHLIRGAGLRTPMFNFLTQKTMIFNNFNAVRIELDLGCPGLDIRAKDIPPHFAWEIDTVNTEAARFPGFYMKRPGQRPEKSLIHERILKCLALQGTLQRPENNPEHKPRAKDHGKTKEGTPCPA
ncbi:MAG: FAD-linked oxidase C-terminal domain-containing protein [Desulfatirhabdiaceae bacterium]